jgi:hypothetical protein
VDEDIAGACGALAERRVPREVALDLGSRLTADVAPERGVLDDRAGGAASAP